MSEAEAAIRKSILVGMAERNARNEIKTEDEAVNESWSACSLSLLDGQLYSTWRRLQHEAV